MHGDGLRVTVAGGLELVVAIKAGDATRGAVRRPDGSFEIFVDPNAPPDVALSGAARELRELAEAPRQTSNDLDRLYRDAGVAQQQLTELTQAVASELGGHVVIPEKLKGRARAEEKIGSDYQGENARITDLARSSIEFDHPRQIEAAVQRIRERAEVVRIKDRFKNPVEGYRDVMMNVRMPHGHVVEIQLHLKAILEVKNGPGHALYEQIRTIKACAKLDGRELTTEEKQQIGRLIREMTGLYDRAYEESERE
jgi:hypothetical protein